MSLAEAIADLAAARGLKPAEVADAITMSRNRATFYRILAGQTTDPRLSTVVTLCETLRVSPSELLQLAGLLEAPAKSPSLVDVALRQTFSDLQDVTDEDRQIAIAIVRSVVHERRRRRG